MKKEDLEQLKRLLKIAFDEATERLRKAVEADDYREYDNMIVTSGEIKDVLLDLRLYFKAE